MAETRKLAAILAADVVGYSKLAGSDEDRTLSRLRGLRSDLIDPAIAAHHGRVVKRTGDGILIEFRSVVDAVRCAIEMQNGMVERNAGLPPERRIEFRVGIHLGDVVEESDGDLMGDGINIAARLEGIAKPGAIYLSEQAYWQVKSRLDLAVSDLGPTQLKNIAEPVRVYSLEVGKPALAKPTKPAVPNRRSIFLLLGVGIVALIAIAGSAWYFLGAQRPVTVTSNAPTARAEAAHLSIVVLPFTNLSNDASQDYFADGITENLTTDLSRLSGAFVIARNTAFTFKGKHIDTKEIGKQLGVRYVLEGSVQRSGNQVRVNTQLIDVETGNHLWAERFDKPLADLFVMQDEIAARLANQLGTELVTAEARRAERAPQPDSTDLYFQGLAWRNKGVAPQYLTQAGSFFERALALDPGNIDALVGTAQADAEMAFGFLTEDRAVRLAGAETALTKALSLAPNNAFAHFWMCAIQDHTNRVAEAMTECERALALDRNLAFAHAEIGGAKTRLGRAEEAEAHVREALRLSPRDTNAFLWMGIAGQAKLHLGDDEEAVAWLRRSIEINRNYPNGHFYLAVALAQLGRLEARNAVHAGLALNPGFTIRRFRASAYSDNPTYLTQRERIYDGMRKAGVPEE